MEKYVEIIKLLERIFGKGTVARSIGTRTNVTRFPKGPQGLDPTTRHFDVAGTAQKNPDLVNTIKNSVEDRIGDLHNMNDQELLNYKQNLQRLDAHLNPPSAEVIASGSKQPVTGKGLESLKQTAGQINPPGTIVGNIESKINQLKQLGKEMEKSTGEKAGIGDVLKEFGTEQSSMSRMQDEGRVRAAARQILINDIRAGKIKNITESEAINMKEPIDSFRKIYGEGALEQLDSLIPEFRELRTEMDAEKLARSKFKFEPDETRLPGSVSIEEGKKAEQEFGINKPAKVSDFKAEATKRKSIDELIDEYNANQDRLRLSDEEGGTLIGYEEFNNLQNRNREIEKALELKGISSEVEPKPEAEIIPFKKKNLEPEEKADGGSAGLDYLMGIPSVEDNILPEEVTKKMKTTPRMMKHYLSNVDDYLNDFLKKFQPRPATIEDILQDSSKEPFSMATGGSIGLDYLMGIDNRPKYASGGDVKKILDIIAKANQELKGKKAMEIINPKTGEITSPINPVKLAQEPRKLGGLPIDDKSADIADRLKEFSSKPIESLERRKQYLDLRSEFIDSLDPRRQNKNLDFQRKSIDTENRLILKAEQKGLDFDTFEELRKRLYDTRKQQTLDFMRTGKVNLEPMKPATTFEDVQDRYKNAAKAHEEIFPNFKDPKTAAQELAEVMAEQKYRKGFDGLSGDQQHDLYSEAYDYITSVNRLPKVSPERVPPEVLEHKMNEVLNSYNKDMFIKNDQGLVDVTHPENISKMEELLRNDHPELYDQLKKLGTDLDQKQTLQDFDITDRKPNKDGGLNYLLGL